MNFKNKKHNYPLYETTHFKEFREMVENVAAKKPDAYAVTYKKKPTDKEELHYTYTEGKE